MVFDAGSAPDWSPEEPVPAEYAPGFSLQATSANDRARTMMAGPMKRIITASAPVVSNLRTPVGHALFGGGPGFSRGSTGDNGAGPSETVERVAAWLAPAKGGSSA